jgi:hypothetical protein
MTAALIQGGTVLNVWDVIPNPLSLPSGSQVYCAREGWTDGDYSVVPASYVDSVPSYPASVLSVSNVLASSGEVQISRTWSTAPAPQIPQSVSNAQARAVLFSSTNPLSTSGTLLDAVNAAVNAAGGEALIAWEYAYEVHRQGAFINSIGKSTAIGLTDAQIDQLFITASSITF